jgi:TPR repeat protein
MDQGGDAHPTLEDVRMYMPSGLLGFLAAIMLAMVPPAVAADFDAGCRAYDQGDFASALEEWRPLAEQGHAQAQFRMGCLLAYGQGVPQDHEQALALFRRSAEQGNADAQNNLGGMYALGWAVETDLIEAYKWFELAASNGLELAQSNRAFVANMLSPGEIEEAEQRARDWTLAQR